MTVNKQRTIEVTNQIKLQFRPIIVSGISMEQHLMIITRRDKYPNKCQQYCHLPEFVCLPKSHQIKPDVLPSLPPYLVFNVYAIKFHDKYNLAPM